MASLLPLRFASIHHYHSQQQPALNYALPALHSASFFQLHHQFHPHHARFSSIASTSFHLPFCTGSESASTTLCGVIEIEDVEELERIIQDSGETLVVINVSTKICGPCKLIHPKFVKMSREYPDAIFLKINGDLNNSSRALMKKWGVRAVPTFKFFRNGNLIHSHTGADEDELRAYFLTHYATAS